MWKIVFQPPGNRLWIAPVDLVIDNLVSPIVLCFVLGLVARWIKSDFELPDAVYQGLSIYLLLAIGLKGGAAVARSR